MLSFFASSVQLDDIFGILPNGDYSLHFSLLNDCVSLVERGLKLVSWCWERRRPRLLASLERSLQ